MAAEKAATTTKSPHASKPCHGSGKHGHGSEIAIIARLRNENPCHGSGKRCHVKAPLVLPVPVQWSSCHRPQRALISSTPTTTPTSATATVVYWTSWISTPTTPDRRSSSFSPLLMSPQRSRKQRMMNIGAKRCWMSSCRSRRIAHGPSLIFLQVTSQSSSNGCTSSSMIPMTMW